MHPSVQCSNAYNTQDMEASVTGEQKKMWHMYPAECYSESNSDTTGSHMDGPRRDHLQ